MLQGIAIGAPGPPQCCKVLQFGGPGRPNCCKVLQFGARSGLVGLVWSGWVGLVWSGLVALGVAPRLSPNRLLTPLAFSDSPLWVF